MKKLIVVAIAFAFIGCEKTCMEWSCDTGNTDQYGNPEYVEVSAPNGHVYGEKNCSCIYEVNRYTGK